MVCESGAIAFTTQPNIFGRFWNKVLNSLDINSLNFHRYHRNINMVLSFGRMVLIPQYKVDPERAVGGQYG